jgi:hypothetical protein
MALTNGSQYFCFHSKEERFDFLLANLAVHMKLTYQRGKRPEALHYFVIDIKNDKIS